ncbi:MAG: 5'/3'-nucleotidase SurE [Treponema sp.]|jgi:5'-nucleotidase|nr:5'/3'-nucleotidase SurE [Treponema sp.]
MRILLTNDDSIASPGITLLAAALRAAGHRVFVVAPETDRSGVSHAIQFFTSPCKLTKMGEDTWICGGTPADCVVIALMGGIEELCLTDESGKKKQPPPIDLVISGINRGANLGTDIVYSGTAAAARQGAFFKIPSLALSLIEGDEWNWDMAAAFAVERLDQMISRWKPDSFINVNIPNQRKKPSALVHAFPSLRYYNDNIEVYPAPDGCQYCFVKAGVISAEPERGSDYEVTAGNNASLSEVFIHPLLLESVKERGGG